MSHALRISHPDDATSPPPAPQLPVEKLLLRPESVAAMLDITARTLRKWVSAEDFPEPDLKKTDKLIFWRRDTVLRWIDEKTRR